MKTLAALNTSGVNHAGLSPTFPSFNLYPMARVAKCNAQCANGEIDLLSLKSNAEY